MRAPDGCRRFILHASISAILIVLTLFLCEQIYRVYLYGDVAFSYTRMNSIHPMGAGGLVRASSDPEIVYELNPGLNAWFKGVPFRTNTRGLRDKEYPIDKSRDTFRVAVVGDSMTMPAGVRIEDAFHSRIEERTDRQEWINFAVGGYTLRQYRAVVTHRLPVWNPDLVLVCFCRMNDHIVPPDHIFRKPYIPKPVTRTFYDLVLVDAIKRFYKNRRKRRKFPIEPAANDGVNTASDGVIPVGKGIDRKVIRQSVFSDRQRAYIAEMFSGIAQYSRMSGVPVVIVFIDLSYDEAFTMSLHRLAAAHDMGFVNLSEPFKGKNCRDYRIFKNDPHPDAEAHRIFADTLYDSLIYMDYLPRPMPAAR